MEVEVLAQEHFHNTLKVLFRKRSQHLLSLRRSLNDCGNLIKAHTSFRTLAVA